MRKRRSDAILFNLPDDVQRAIYEYSERPNVRLEDVRDALVCPVEEGDKEHPGFGLKEVVSIATISGFLTEWRVTAFRRKLQSRAALAHGVDDTLTDEDRAAMDQATLDGLREWILDSVSQRELGPKDIQKLVGLILKDRRMAIDERKVALLEKKAAAYDMAKEKGNKAGGLTAEDLAEIERKLKLL